MRGVFEAVVRQVVGRWACEEAREAGRMDGRDAGGIVNASGIVNAGGVIERGRNIKAGRRWGTVEVGAPQGNFKKGKGAGCCA